MKDLSTLDRETASALNPFISVFTEDTLAAAANAIFDLGYLIASHQEGSVKLHAVFDCIATALRYEIAHPNSTAVQRRAA